MYEIWIVILIFLMINSEKLKSIRILTLTSIFSVFILYEMGLVDAVTFQVSLWLVFLMEMYIQFVDNNTED